MSDRSNSAYCPNLVMYSHYLCFFAAGVLVGWWCKNDERIAPNLKYPTEGASQGFVDTSWTLKEVETLDATVQALELSKNQFACNSLKAFEELTRLHRRAENLREHEKRGEANRDRYATIRRKATAASSAESAFRKCVSSFMPELLNLWDEKFKLGQIDFRAWNDAKEKDVDGISLQTLEKTAEYMDNF